jgi:pimeloyl-ACP methyl ester carboxylesterase
MRPGPRARQSRGGRGGRHGCLFAVAHPERANALVLGNTQARWAAADDYPIGLTPSDIAQIVELVESTWGKNDLDACPLVFPSLAGDEPVLTSLSRLLRAAATPRMAGALYRYIYNELDVREALSLVQAPTLVLHNHRSDTERAISPITLTMPAWSRCPATTFFLRW